VVWEKNQIARNASKDQIMTYLDQVKTDCHYMA